MGNEENTNFEKELMKQEILMEFKRISTNETHYTATYFPNGEDVLLCEEGEKINIIKFGMIGVGALPDGNADADKILFNKAIENIKAIIKKYGFYGEVKKLTNTYPENGIEISNLTRKKDL